MRHLTLSLLILLLVSVGHVTQVQAQETAQIHEIQRFGVNEEMYDVNDVVVSTDDKVYIVDYQGYSIHQFDPDGSYIGSVGQQGQGPGDFEHGPARAAISNDTLAVLELAGGRLSFFDKNFNHLSIERFRGANDIAHGPDGSLYLNLDSYQENHTLIRVSQAGNVDTFHQRNAQPAFDNYNSASIGVAQDGTLFSALLYQNILRKYDQRGNVLREWSIDELPDEPEIEFDEERRAEAVERFGPYPEWVDRNPRGPIIRDIAINSDGQLVALGGRYSANPNRDLYIFSEEGHLIATGRLPSPSLFIYIDHNGYLYAASERQMQVVKYRIDW